jgi:F420-non-reducing hydrogenase small subunit
MADEKIKVAVSWAAACGGCDVSLLDLEEKVLELAEIADFVFWPVAMDFKRDQLAALPDGSVDIGIFNGAIRTTEQKEDAELFRRKCRLLVAYGSCATFGGIPGLGNLAKREALLEVAYDTTASTENPDGTRPATEHPLEGHTLTLPGFLETTAHLAQVVDVDLSLPGCPPPTARIADLVAAVAAYASDGAVPPKGTVVAESKALCDSCPRAETRRAERITRFVRPHEVVADPSECFLNQGLLCMGIATRGGCGHTCIAANMPCRGCFGPTPDMLDPGAEAISAIGSIAGAANENDVPAHEMKKGVKSVVDPAGTFYRFTLPSALLSRVVVDKPE